MAYLVVDEGLEDGDFVGLVLLEALVGTSDSEGDDDGIKLIEGAEDGYDTVHRRSFRKV